MKSLFEGLMMMVNLKGRVRAFLLLDRCYWLLLGFRFLITGLAINGSS
jgi:hypothetical protein